MKGQCLCGAVTITAPDKTDVSACHCGMCQRWAGGPLLAVSAGQDVEIDGSDAVTRYRSSEWAERAFCSKCGTHIYFRVLPTNDYIVFPGLFADRSFELKEQIFIDRKPAGYAFANQTENLTEAEFLAKYAPG